jgi:hypothetical protein
MEGLVLHAQAATHFGVFVAVIADDNARIADDGETARGSG